MPTDVQWVFDTYRLDRDNTVLWHGEKRVPLWPKTFALLAYLVEHAGQLVSKDVLLKAIWPHTTVSDTVLKTCIGEIRKALRDSAQAPRFIITVQRRGYRFIAPVTPVAQSADPSEPARLSRVPAPLSPATPVMSHPAPASQWRFGAFRLDPDNACLWQDEQMIALRPTAFAVLAYLVQHAGQLVTKETLLNHVWPETAVGDAALKVCIAHLRKTFGETAQNAQFIATVHRHGYRFIAPVTVVEPPAVKTVIPMSTPSPHLLAAREAELTRLHQCLETVLQGERQIAFITGAIGIGKTTLVDAFVTQLAQWKGETELWIGRGQCIEPYGAGEAYLPLLEAVEQLCHPPHGTSVIDILYRQAPSWLLQMPSLVSADDEETPRRRCAETTPERMVRELAEALETLTAEQPLVLVLEDLHWSDVSTLDWLAYVARRRSAARLFILGTYRSVDAMVRAHPLRTTAQELLLQNHVCELALSYLSVAEVAAYLQHRFSDAALTQKLAHLIHQRTNGNPLFMVNVVADIIRHGILRQGPGGWQLCGDLEAVAQSVPENLRQLIERQFEELGSDEQD